MNFINQLFFQDDEKVGHVKSLDGLRGLAIILVLLSHSSNGNIFFHEFLNFQRIGKSGVFLFFILSAYLLDKQITLAFKRDIVNLQFWKTYFAKRFLRIFPAFIISLLLYRFLNVFELNHTLKSWESVLSHIFLLEGLNHFWSIPAEFKYYLISPLVMMFCHYVLKWSKISVVSFLIISILVTAAPNHFFDFHVTSTIGYLPIFLVGTFLSVYEVNYDLNFNNNIRKSINYLATLCLIIVLLTAPYYHEKLLGESVNFQETRYYLLYSVLWGMTLLAALKGKGFIKRLFENKLLCFFGKISFSLYLFHAFIIEILWPSTAVPQELKVYVFFTSSIIIASLSYLLIEKPAMKLIKYSR